MVRPLSLQNLALNRGGRSDPFSPADVDQLTIWYDPSDASARTVNVGSPSLLTDLVNKADPGNGDADDGISASNAPLFVADGINGLAAMDFDSSAVNRALAMRDITYADDNVGTGDFHTFFVVQADAGFSGTTQMALMFHNVATNIKGGGYNLKYNAGTAGTTRFTAADIIDASRTVVTANWSSSSLFDGNPHVVHMARRNGAGAADADRFTLHVDGTQRAFQDVTGMRALHNDGSTSAVTAWLMLGASGAAPTNGANFAYDCMMGEVIMCVGSVNEGDQGLILSYLSNKWGVS